MSSIKCSQIDLPFLKMISSCLKYIKAAIKIDLILMTAITNLYAFVLYMRYKKYGAPIMATTIPAGTPDGCKMTFPNVSENTSKMHQLKSL